MLSEHEPRKIFAKTVTYTSNITTELDISADKGQITLLVLRMMHFSFSSLDLISECHP